MKLLHLAEVEDKQFFFIPLCGIERLQSIHQIMTVAGLQVLSVNTSKQSEHLFKHAEKVTQHGNNTDLLVGFFFEDSELAFWNNSPQNKHR